jgi:hypothetical protein
MVGTLSQSLQLSLSGITLDTPSCAGQQIVGTSSLGEETIDDMLECLELFDKANEEQLKKRIPQPDYYTNFIALARNIAPDGADVKLVGFSALRAGKVRTVAMTGQNLSEVRFVPTFEKAALEAQPAPETSVTTVQGFLKEADSRDSKQGKIHIVDAEGVSHSIIVPLGMMSDIVKPLWDSEVVITGDQKGKTIHLTEIHEVKRPRAKK